MNRLFILVLCWALAPFAWAKDVFESQLEQDFVQARAAFVEVYKDDTIDAPRIQAVSRQLKMRGVQVLVLKGSPFGLGAYVAGLVILDASMESETNEAIGFVLAHEYSHHTAKHWRTLVPHAAALARKHADLEPLALMKMALGTRPSSESHQHEFEADDLAKKRMQAAGLWSDEGVGEFIVRRVWKSESDTHPASLARLQALGIAQ